VAVLSLFGAELMVVYLILFSAEFFIASEFTPPSTWPRRKEDAIDGFVCRGLLRYPDSNNLGRIASYTSRLARMVED